MRTCVSGRERRPIEQSRATTGEQSRERPSRPLLPQKLARTSLPHPQPLCINQVTAQHARRRGAVLHHMPHPERLRWASRSRRGAAGPQIRGFGTRKGALSARRDAPLSRSFSRMRTSLLSRSSPTPQGVHAHGRTPALFAPRSPQQHQHPGLSLHHRHHLALHAAEFSLILTGRSGTAGLHNIPGVRVPTYPHSPVLLLVTGSSISFGTQPSGLLTSQKIESGGSRIQDSAITVAPTHHGSCLRHSLRQPA